MAVILAQAMNHGNLGMAETSDIPYHVLEATHQQHLRLSTLKAANDRVSNFIASLGIFPLYSFDPEVLYGMSTARNSARPTRRSRRGTRAVLRHRQGRGRLHAAGQPRAAGDGTDRRPEHESYHVFDICYHNTSDIAPTAITGDMHSINRANFAILHWSG